jgi:hypothetical protein
LQEQRRPVPQRQRFSDERPGGSLSCAGQNELPRMLFPRRSPLGAKKGTERATHSASSVAGHEFDGPGWTGNGKRPVWRLQRSRRSWFEAYVVVHRVAKPLLTAKVSLRRLDAHMAEQKLDLLELTTGFVAQTGACAP